MRRAQTWARRATVVLLSLAMAVGGLPPVALAETLDNAEEAPFIENLDDAAEDEDPLELLDVDAADPVAAPVRVEVPQTEPADDIQLVGVDDDPDVTVQSDATIATVTTADGTSTPYVTPATALEAWTDGGTLTLQADWDYGEIIPIDGHGNRTLDLNGYGIIGEDDPISDDGSGKGSLTIVDGNPDAEHRYTVGPDGQATVDDDLTENYQTFRGGYITGGASAIFLDGARLSMTGGTLIGCGNGAVWSNAGTLELTGTTVTGNIAYFYSCGLLLFNTKATLRDVTVTGNVEEDGEYGAVYACGTRRVSVLGSTTIYGNFAGDGETPNNLFLDDVMLTVAGPLTGTIGVRGPYGTFTSGLPGNGDLSNFVSDRGNGHTITLTDEGEAQFALPEGVLIIPSSGSDTYEMNSASVGDTVTVYDAGGPDGDYELAWDGTLTIVPPAGKAIQVTGSVDTRANYDYLYVYETSAEGDALATVSGNDQNVDVTVIDDPLVLRFTSGYLFSYSGVELTVTVVDVPADHDTQNKHNVTCSPAEHGTVSVDKTSTWEGKTVTITATPDEGYLLSGITVNDEPIQTSPKKSTYTFVMGTGDATVAASFQKGALVTFLDSDGTELSSKLIQPGSTVTAPYVIDKGFILTGWEKDGAPFDFATPITEDTTLTTVWVEGKLIREDFFGGIPSDWTQDGDELWEDHAYADVTLVIHPYDEGTESRLIMPAVDLSGSRYATLYFEYANRLSGGKIDHLGVDYRVGKDGAWKTIFQTTEAHTWTEHSLDLIDLIPEEDRTDEVYLAFHGYGNDGHYSYLYYVRLAMDGHDWTYAADDEADVIRATCGNGAEACTVDGAQATIALVAKDSEYTGKPVEATVKVDDAWTKANGLVEPDYALAYSQGGNPLKSAPTKVGTYTATLTLGEGEGAFSVSKDFSITPKVVGLKWSGTKFTYDGKKHVPTAKATGLVGGDKCTVTVTGAKKGAGTHTATATKLSNKNYKLPAKSTTKFTIAKAKLTVTAKDKTIKFGAAAANAGVTYSGFKGNDTANSLGGKLKFNYGGYKKGAKVGTYKITPSGLSSKNYKITYKKGTLTVEAPATVGTKGQVLADGKGWVKTGKGGVFGTTGQSRRTTGIRIGLAKLPYKGGIQYCGAFQGSWQRRWTFGNAKCSVKDKRLEAVQIRLTGQMAKEYDVWYRVHVQRLGWMAWTKNGASAGTTGKSRRLEAVQVVVLKKGSTAPSKDYGGVRQTYGKAFVGK